MKPRTKGAITAAEITRFRRKIMTFYKAQGRHDLPFRKTVDPYRIAVSEFMLQQTQVSRVLPKYRAWIQKWPSWHSLAKATPTELLREWSGLGYNRRALFLGKLAQAVSAEFGGKLPNTEEQLRSLPGIGPYTSRAILIFAFNADLITVDTNVRRVLIQELDLPRDITMADLETIAQRALPKGKSREWHYALMDYGATALPRRIADIPPTSKQGKFEGSDRQLRGAIVRELTKAGTMARARLRTTTKAPSEKFERVLLSLQKDGLIVIEKNQVRLP